MRKLSGNHAGWLTTVAREVREAGKPVSLQFLVNVVPGQFATSTNDGHVTAAENGLDRNDYRAGQRIWVEEAVTALRKAGLVDGPDDALVWTSGQDGTWQVRFGRGKPTIYGRAESAAAADRHMLGHNEQPGYLLRGWSEASVEIKSGIRNVIKPGRHTLEVHPLALAIPPMTPAEQEQVRADIAEHGVRMPLILYPDQADKTARGTPKVKVLDGRHRLQFASALNKPVRVELFEGTEDEARQFIKSLNLDRRHLTAAQRALSIERLFGEQARREAKEDQIRKPETTDSVRVNPAEQNNGKSEKRRWEYRALELAGGAGISPRSVRHMAEVVKAPETVAKIENNEIRTVTAAVREAAAELGKPAPTNVWQDTVRAELGRARGHLKNVLDQLDMPTELTKPGELGEILVEIEQITHEIRDALGKQGVL